MPFSQIFQAISGTQVAYSAALQLFDALSNVGGGLKAVVNLPEAERETIRRMLDETFLLIATTRNMVIIRLAPRDAAWPNRSEKCECSCRPHGAGRGAAALRQPAQWVRDGPGIWWPRRPF